MMGGSTTWGEGVPDADTMPSQLQKILGPGYDVYNFGDIAYTSVQELAYLQERLTRGDIPDVVVFMTASMTALSRFTRRGSARYPRHR